jgi:hypothetical protein
MNRITKLIVGFQCVATAMATVLPAQPKSHSTGLFLSAGAELNEIAVAPGQTSAHNASAAGPAISLGYGFTRRWSLLAHIGMATFTAARGNETWVGSLGVDARVHLLPTSSAFMPFAQVGVANRVLTMDVVRNGAANAAFFWRYLPSFGGGMNAHLARGAALTGSVLWNAGTFRTAEEKSYRITKPLIQLGVILFPGAYATK